MKTTLNHTVIPWFLLVASLVLAVVCVWATEFSLLYKIALGLIFACAIMFRHNFGKPIITVARLLIGIVFLFSGFVKAVDPAGTQFQIMDYFAAYGTQWANPFAKLMAMGLNIAEIVLGVALVLNLRMQITAWLVMLMMAFFTWLTFMDATFFQDRISDCGCFGQAIILTPWQTFYKNMVLNIWVVIVLFGRNKTGNPFSLKTEIIIVGITGLLFLLIQVHAFRNLPTITFLDWRPGAQLNPPREPITFTTKFQNQETQEIREFTSEELAGIDRSIWTFVETIIHDPNPPNLASIMIPIFDCRGIEAVEMGSFVADRPGYTFIVSIRDAERANIRNMPKIFALMDFAKQNGHEFMFLFDGTITDEALEDFKQRVGRRDFNAYFASVRDIMAIVRSNPGLILIHDGYISKQWAWRNVPSVERIGDFVK